MKPDNHSNNDLFITHSHIFQEYKYYADTVDCQKNHYSVSTRRYYIKTPPHHLYKHKILFTHVMSVLRVTSTGQHLSDTPRNTANASQIHAALHMHTHERPHTGRSL